ncbi:cold shock domain-containing protein [Amycolatopsis sp. NPDC049688]|uniref:cold-shock protein n=1 Tax=Amycolatopsis sp. NPDC049688 TaxID=3154733 RepID=UPI00341A6043
MDTRRGRVREWHADEGWGVVETPGSGDPVWVHFSVIDAAGGFRELTPGAEVEFTAEDVEQDGYRRRATWVRG